MYILKFKLEIGPETEGLDIILVVSLVAPYTQHYPHFTSHGQSGV
jgi:hypothetical protein